ncbi:N-acetylmannosamine kinase [Vibrio tubiashii]|uniref:N-acetylmannosamine kinase n=1 Tax=Vibrio tubiashii TaxID=29498 RepID=UPI001EFE1288|nr:N-acetylmannosamine kinase [Vibrio tubiashii]MCG9581305.1 N-acetylmannosamine kinase [Vibrio tubiashii]MCG9614896.1 N-acetylmannosamine kinase [Vibrio tubiashii]MCG9688771.1 N-acetylmannosamine kinase [Vibrio tubiashii]
MRTLAIDIGGTKIALGFIENNKLIQRCQIATPIAHSAEQFVETILGSASQWLEHVDNIGISTTGLVTQQGISAINPETLAFPTPFPLAQVLQSIVGKPVSMLNDAQAAALFEYTMLETPVKNMAFITVSTGVGGGIIIDGQLHQGQGGLAGHVGHMVIDPNGPQCGCGQTGCVESIASGTAIKKTSDAAFSNPISNIELFEQASSNPEAETIISQSANAIATLCCNLKASLDLDLIVLGGGVGLARNYIQRVEQAIQRRPTVFQIPVKAAKGNYDACLLGAAFQFKE